jgi:hypothetical protein
MRHNVADMHETWKEQSPCSTFTALDFLFTGITSVEDMEQVLIFVN